MAYKITIVEIESVKNTYREWRNTITRPVTDEEWDKMKYYQWETERSKMEKFTAPTITEGGYVDVTKLETFETKLFEQTLDKIDLQAVIIATNQIQIP